jgi:uncharacterized Zn finger protein
LTFGRRRRRTRWTPRDRGFDAFGFVPYVSADERRRRAARHAAALRNASPIVIDGRKIVETFWGESWCRNLERYSDFANRLPRGRSYVRGGAVVDLRIQPGRVEALVSGSDLYQVSVQVAAVQKKRWQAICRDTAGAIDSVIELLQGRLSTSVMTRLCQEGTGLFPAPKEIQFSCSCPDFAWMCKHVAAVLYGIGARFDRDPALLFVLRQVNETDLVGSAGSVRRLVKRSAAASRKTVDDAVLADVFGLDIAPPSSRPPSRAKPASARRAPARRRAGRNR